MLVLRVRPSSLESAFLLVIHGIALLAVFSSSLNSPISLLIAVFILCSLMYHTGHLPGLDKPRLLEIQIAAHQCSLQTTHHKRVTNLPQVLFYSEWLIILQFVDLLYGSENPVASGPAQSIVHFLPDSLAEEEDRQLRCYLRFLRD